MCSAAVGTVRTSVTCLYMLATVAEAPSCNPAGEPVTAIVTG